MNRVYSYIAGLFDGEGCITLFYRKDKGKQAKAPTPWVSLGNTDYNLIRFLQNTFNGYVFHEKKKEENWNDMWYWKLTNIDNVISFLEKIYPYLKHQDKQEKARLIIEDYKFRVKKGATVTKEDIKNNREFYNEFYANRKSYN